LNDKHQEKEDQRLEQLKLLQVAAFRLLTYSNRFEQFSVFRHPALPGVFDLFDKIEVIFIGISRVFFEKSMYYRF
jgi:hypothetical protein